MPHTSELLFSYEIKAFVFLTKQAMQVKPLKKIHCQYLLYKKNHKKQVMLYEEKENISANGRHCQMILANKHFFLHCTSHAV